MNKSSENIKKQVKGSMGMLTTLPQDEAVIEIARIYQVVSKESNTRASANSDRASSVGSALGALGDIMSVIKPANTEEKNFSITIKNDSEHVFYPAQVDAATGFYATSNFDVITPGCKSELSFEKISLSNFNGDKKLTISFIVTSELEKTVTLKLDIEKIAAQWLLTNFHLDDDSIEFHVFTSDTKGTLQLEYVNFEAANPSFPSFGAACLTTDADAESLSITITPWRVASV